MTLLKGILTQHIVSTTRVLAQYEQIRAYLVSDSRFDLSQKEKKKLTSLKTLFFPSNHRAVTNI